jgi:hypothetical protein
MPDLIEKQLVEGAEADAVRARLAAKLATRTTKAWESFFAPLDVMVEPIRSPEQVLREEPQFAGANPPRRVTARVLMEGGAVQMPCLPFMMGSFYRTFVVVIEYSSVCFAVTLLSTVLHNIFSFVFIILFCFSRITGDGAAPRLERGPALGEHTQAVLSTLKSKL